MPPPRQYSIKLACDGLSALTKSLLTEREYFNSSQKDFDLISRIIDHRDSLIGHIVPMHVKGHQDNRKGPLTRAATLNTRMDALAKELNTFTYEQNLDVPDALPPSTEGLVQVDYGLEPIVSDLCTTLINRISESRLKQYWRRKGRLDQTYAATWIDWKVMKVTMQESSRQMKFFISKWVSNCTAVGEIMIQRKDRANGQCPCCGFPLETQIHVLRCQSKDSNKVWKKGRKVLKKWLIAQDTDPRLTSSLCHILRQFTKRDDFNIYVPTVQDSTVQTCLNVQSHLGWVHFLEGSSRQTGQLHNNPFMPPLTAGVQDIDGR